MVLFAKHLTTWVFMTNDFILILVQISKFNEIVKFAAYRSNLLRILYFSSYASDPKWVSQMNE